MQTPTSTAQSLHQLFNRPWNGPVPLSIPARLASNPNAPIPHWQTLRCNPVGLYWYQRWIGEYSHMGSFFKLMQAQIRSGAIAYFASGNSRDGNHSHAADSFHPQMGEFTRETSGYTQGKAERTALLAEVQDLLFDVACMLDRMSGSTTIVIRSGGTKVPGSPTRPEYLKAHVYLPPAFLAHNNDLHSPILRIVQQYIETVGVRTVNQWANRARNDLGYTLTQTGGVSRPNNTMTVIPAPEHKTAHYIFLGQPVKVVDEPSLSQVSVESYGYENSTLGRSSQAQLNLQEEIDLKDMQIANLNNEVDSLTDQVGTLMDQLDNCQRRMSQLEELTRNHPYPLVPVNTPAPTDSPTPATPSSKRTQKQKVSNIAANSYTPPPSQLVQDYTSLFHSSMPRSTHVVREPSTPIQLFRSRLRSLETHGRDANHSPGAHSPGPSAIRPIASSNRSGPLSPFSLQIVPALLAKNELHHLEHFIELIARYIPRNVRVDALKEAGVPEGLAPTLASLIQVELDVEQNASDSDAQD